MKLFVVEVIQESDGSGNFIGFFKPQLSFFTNKESMWEAVCNFIVSKDGFYETSLTHVMNGKDCLNDITDESMIAFVNGKTIVLCGEPLHTIKLKTIDLDPVILEDANSYPDD